MQPVRPRLPRSLWRWVSLAVVVAVLAALPTVLRDRPVSASSVSAAELLARVRSSAGVAWSGYGESRGGVALPDVPSLGDTGSLLGGTTRTRVWWRSPSQWRVDTLAINGENDIATDPYGTWTWDSADRRALRVDGTLPVHLPQSPDLVAPVLGRRLAGTPGVVAARLPSRRVAGVDAPGLRLTSPDPSATTISSVDEWVDPANGLVLRLQVNAKGEKVPSLTSLLLDLDASRPSLADASFTLPLGSTSCTSSKGASATSPTACVSSSQAPDIASRIEQLAPYVLPDSLAGLSRSTAAGDLTTGGVGVYGTGFAQVIVIPLPRGEARSLTDKVLALGGTLSSPLVNVLVVPDQFQGRNRRYLMAGTVPTSTLVGIGAALLADPPQRNVDFQ